LGNRTQLLRVAPVGNAAHFYKKGRKVAKKMDLGPVAVLAAGFVGAKMLGSAKDKRDDKKRSSSRDNRQGYQSDGRYDDNHHHSHRH
jgi:hypothetical protein